MKITLLTVVVVTVLGATLAPSWASDYEKPQTLTAAASFPSIPLETENYRINSKVPTDGFLTRAAITSEFGDFIAQGPGMLEIRLQEINALVKLKTFEASEEFQQGAKDSTQEKIGGLKQIYEKPKETAMGIGEGVSRFFKRTYRASKTGAQTISDVFHDQTPGITEGPGANLPGKYQSQAEPDSESKYEKAARASGNTAINILGFDDSRRKLAKRLGVDPYTTNTVLDEKLDEITWAIFGGDFGVDLVTSLIPGGAIVSTSTLVTNWVWDTPPGDLRVKMEQILLGVGINQEDVDRLLRHRFYPMTYQAALTAAMEDLGNVNGIEKIMPLALSVTTVDQARFVVNSMRMLGQYHSEVLPLQAIDVQGTVFAINADESVVIAAPVDYLSWTDALDRFSGNDTLTGQKHELHIAGTMSAKARKHLKEREWLIHEKSDLFTTIIASK